MNYNEKQASIKQRAQKEARELLTGTFHKCCNDNTPVNIRFTDSVGKVVQMDSPYISRGYSSEEFPRITARKGDMFVAFDDSNIYQGKEILGKMIFHVSVAKIFILT